MNRKNFYENLPTELLACFYCFVQKKINKGEHINRMLFENSQIEKVAKERGISLVELKIIGNWFIQKEFQDTLHELDKNEE